ncbi:MAG: YdgA family protein [Steroidobacteraceae bacterium]
MTRATKTLLVIVGIIVLSYPGLAWLTGIAIESRMQHSQQQVLDQVPYLTLVSRTYHRGVYRSTEIATYDFHIPLPPLMKAGAAAIPRGATLTVESTIEHGPLPGLRTVALATIDSTVLAPPAVQKALAGVLGSSPILKTHTTVGLFGGATIDLTSPAFNLGLPGGFNLTWGGLTGIVTATRSQAHWTAQLTAPHLALQGPKGGLELVSMEYSGSHQKAFDSLYLGTGTFTIEQVDGSTPSGGKYSLQRISLSSVSKAHGQFFDVRVDVAMDAAQVAAVQLKNVMYSEAVEHLHGPSLASMVQAMRVAERQAHGNRAQFQAGMQDAFRQYGVEVLVNDPVLDIRQVSFAMPEGSFLLSAKISAPGLARAELLQWPAAIVALKNHAEVTVDLRVDNGLMQKLLAMGGSNPKIAAQLASFEQMGYLTAGPGAVTTHVGYAGGQLTLNGHPFPPTAPVK